MTPPGFKRRWDDLDLLQQAQAIAYNQIREYEEAEIVSAAAAIGSLPK